MKIFACSDHHFEHKNIIKYADRPFDINHKDCLIDSIDYMIQKHNCIVQEDDYVLFVGDITLHKKDNNIDNFIRTINKFNGKKILVLGNHDKFELSVYKDAGFIFCTEYIISEDTFICHYPLYKSKWNRGREPWLINQLKKTNCTKVIHGHIHNKNPDLWEPDGIKRINVCVDYAPNDFKPIDVTTPELLQTIQTIQTIQKLGE